MCLQTNCEKSLENTASSDWMGWAWKLSTPTALTGTPVLEPRGSALFAGYIGWSNKTWDFSAQTLSTWIILGNGTRSCFITYYWCSDCPGCSLVLTWVMTEVYLVYRLLSRTEVQFVIRFQLSQYTYSKRRCFTGWICFPSPSTCTRLVTVVGNSNWARRAVTGFTQGRKKKSSKAICKAP